MCDYINYYSFFFFLKIGVYVVCSYCFLFKKKKEKCKGVDDVVVKFFLIKEGMCFFYIEMYFFLK